MNRQIKTLKELLGEKNHNKSYTEFNNNLLLFESENGLLIPPDLAEYFRLLDNATNELDKDLYQFYSFDQFKSVEKELALWNGIPNYSNLINTLEHCENCFVFADYMSHLFAYAIRLYHNTIDFNLVYMICGDKYKVIANSFSAFLDLYFDDSMELKLFN